MTHTFKRAVLFAAVVSMGAASAVSMPKVSMPKVAMPEFVKKAARAQYNFLQSRKGNIVTAALLVANTGVHAYSEDAFGMPRMPKRKDLGAGFFGLVSSLNPKTAIPLKWVGYEAGRKQVGKPASHDFVGQIGTPAVYGADGVTVTTPASADFVAQVGTAPSSDYRPGKKTVWGKPSVQAFNLKGFGKGTLRAATVVVAGLKVANLGYDLGVKIKAKRAAAKAAKPAQA